MKSFTRKPRRRSVPADQRGASMVEFLTVAPPLLLLGLGALQLGLIHHGKTILDYATFEAARAGAVDHALPEPMRRELAVRLAPIMGGDGTGAKASEAIARSVADLASPVGPDGLLRPMTTVERLNPTPAAFADWGVYDPVAERTVIPNSHLRTRLVDEAPRESGMSLRDANILEIEVRHGFELKVPVAGKVLTTALTLLDPENAAWYATNRLPLSSVATVRMQSDVWMPDGESATSTAPDDDGTVADGEAPTAVPDYVDPEGGGGTEGGDGGGGSDGDGGGGDSEGGRDREADGTPGTGVEDVPEQAIEPVAEAVDDPVPTLPESAPGDESVASDVCGGYGLGGEPYPMSESDYLAGSCSVDDGVRGSPDADDVPGLANTGLESSPVWPEC